ncbi:MAG: cytochrome c [Gammaproteobacteria bacterium]|nr:cytochrome c [Gammaproteobacteria bacterium]MYD02227.1 cytochrome c [Gammaproteobacteria bacterium]MYI25080.1 cytochrome c [Gammaproteobacteria bacterium]
MTGASPAPFSRLTFPGGAIPGSVSPSLASTLPERSGVKKASVFAVLLLAAALVVSGGLQALPWNDDMKDQVSIKTQETTVELPAESVPADGGELDGPADLAELVRARLRAGEQLSNPLVAEDPDDGRAAEMYDVYCRVCHGVAGAGDGSVGLKYNPQPMDLTLPYVQQQTDGQLYYTITHGGVIMPSYRFAMSSEDRWRIVQYLRTGLIEEAAKVADAAEAEPGGETAAE